MTLAPVKFRLRCGSRSHHYFTVLIFPDKTTMQQFQREQAKLVGVKRRFKFLALTTQWGIRKGERQTIREVGQLLFCEQHIGSGIVSHECTHAALYYVDAYTRYFKHRRDRSGCTEAADERLAWVQGWLVHQFWRTFYRLGLDRKFVRSKRRAAA